MAEKTQELVDVINSQSRELYILIATLVDIYSVTFELQLKLTLENTLSYLEMFEQELKQYDALFMYHRDLSEIGHLTESLVSRNELSTFLSSINSDCHWIIRIRI